MFRKTARLTFILALFVSFAHVSASAAEIVLRLSETHAANYPTVTGGDQKFADLVAERSGGRIKINIYHSSQLGEERAAVEQAQFGGIDFVCVGISLLTTYDNFFSVVQLPYLYRDREHTLKVLNGPLGDEVLQRLEDHGFEGMCWYLPGERNFYTKRQVKTLADMKGMKIRVQENPLMINFIKALGAVPTPLPLGEVYGALQTGVVDGAENDYPSYYSTSHYEVAKFYNLDRHSLMPEVIVASKISMDALSPADQELIRTAARDSQATQLVAWDEFEKIAMQKVVDGGSTIVTIEDADIEDFRRAVQPLYDNLPKPQADFVKRIRDVQ